MEEFQFASGFGDQRRNVHSFKFPTNAHNHEYFVMVFNAESRNAKSCKILDKAGCEHDLPYFFQKGDIEGIDIVVYSSVAEKYSYQATLRGWPKELQMPIAKYHSLTSVDIISADKCDKSPIGQYRKKGDAVWKSGDRLIFDSANDLYECQLYYNLYNGIIIQSPILEVACTLEHVNFEKEFMIDWEQVVVHCKFKITFDERSEKELKKCEVTISLIEPTNHPDYNQIILAKALFQTIKINKSPLLVRGGRYECKVDVPDFNKTFTRVFDVPLNTIDDNIWKKLFGDVDEAVFSHRMEEFGENWNEDYGVYQSTSDIIEHIILTFYKSGVYHYCTVKYNEPTISTGGTFSILPANDSETAKFILTNLFRRSTEHSYYQPNLRIYNTTRPQPLIISNIAHQSQAPAPLQLTEIIQTIAADPIARQNPQWRLVCKSWCKVMPHPVGTVALNINKHMEYDGFKLKPGLL